MKFNELIQQCNDNITIILENFNEFSDDILCERRNKRQKKKQKKKQQPKPKKKLTQDEQDYRAYVRQSPDPKEFKEWLANKNKKPEEDDETTDKKHEGASAQVEKAAEVINDNKHLTDEEKQSYKDLQDKLEKAETPEEKAEITKEINAKQEELTKTVEREESIEEHTADVDQTDAVNDMKGLDMEEIDEDAGAEKFSEMEEDMKDIDNLSKEEQADKAKEVVGDIAKDKNMLGAVIKHPKEMLKKMGVDLLGFFGGMIGAFLVNAAKEAGLDDALKSGGTFIDAKMKKKEAQENAAAAEAEKNKEQHDKDKEAIAATKAKIEKTARDSKLVSQDAELVLNDDKISDNDKYEINSMKSNLDDTLKDADNEIDVEKAMLQYKYSIENAKLNKNTKEFEAAADKSYSSWQDADSKLSKIDKETDPKDYEEAEKNVKELEKQKDEDEKVFRDAEKASLEAWSKWDEENSSLTAKQKETKDEKL